jgi:hypothetical protein
MVTLSLGSVSVPPGGKTVSSRVFAEAPFRIERVAFTGPPVRSGVSFCLTVNDIPASRVQTVRVGDVLSLEMINDSDLPFGSSVCLVGRPETPSKGGTPGPGEPISIKAVTLDLWFPATVSSWDRTHLVVGCGMGARCLAIADRGRTWRGQDDDVDDRVGD